MKNRMLFLSMFFLLALISSCKKPANSETLYGPITCNASNFPSETLVSLIGKWNIITDSTFINVGRDNQPGNYAGKTDDYFDFRTDGKLYTKESMKLDTFVYKLTSDTTILIPVFGITLNGVIQTSCITNLTVHTATINAPISITPGGLFGRKVILSR